MAALYSYEPAGMLNVPCQTPSSRARWVLAQPGCQSSGHPTSDWKLPGMVTLAGCCTPPPAPAETVSTWVEAL
jgi:hypothetical protein